MIPTGNTMTYHILLRYSSMEAASQENGIKLEMVLENFILGDNTLWLEV